jgi:hypothetical protein
MGTTENTSTRTGEQQSIQAIIAISPGHRCWHCERPLPADFCGVTASTPIGEFVFVLCGDRCRADELVEIASCGLAPRALGTAAVREILSRPEDLTSVVEAQRFSGGVLARIGDASLLCGNTPV